MNCGALWKNHRVPDRDQATDSPGLTGLGLPIEDECRSKLFINVALICTECSELIT